MSDFPSSGAPKTFWFRPSGGDTYLIPDDVELPSGELEIRTLVGGKRLVDEDALAQWVADTDAVREHLKGRATEGLQKFAAELGEAWRRGVAEGAAATTQEAASEAGQAEANARKIESAAASIVSGLRELSEKLEKAVRDAAENEAAKARNGSAPDDAQGHEEKLHGSGRA